MIRTHDRYALLASGALALGVGLETFRLFPGHTWPGYDASLSRVVSALLIALFAITAVSAVLRRRHRVFASLVWVLSILSPLFMIAHAAVTRVGGTFVGLVYVPLAVTVAFALKRTLDRREWAELPTSDAGGRVAGAEKSYRLIPRPRG
jgi:hypothetical protein